MKDYKRLELKCSMENIEFAYAKSKSEERFICKSLFIV